MRSEAATGAAPVDVPDADPTSRGAPVRLFIWAFHVALPLLGLWLLLQRPQLDMTWEHHPAHFWLVLSVAMVNVALGLRMSEAARRRSDARLFLVSLAFLASAGFLFLHALATPGVLLSGPNAGFVVATPVGLFIASVFAAASSISFTPRGSAVVMRYQAVARGGLLLLLLTWAVASLLDLPLLHTPPSAQEAHGPFAGLAITGVILYVVAAVRYYLLYRRRPAVMLISVITAFVLLGEAMIAVVMSRNWHAAWWEWHLLMAAGFGFVAYSAYVQYQREGAARGLFNSITLEQTVRRIDEEYATALEALTSAMHRQEDAGWTEAEMALIISGLARRFGLTEGQVGILGRAAEALAHERDQIRRLDALVAVGNETRVIVREPELLRRMVARIAEGLGRDSLRVGLLVDGRMTFPADLSTGDGWGAGGASDSTIDRALSSLRSVPAGDGLLVLPLTVKDRPAGVVEVRRPAGGFAERDHSLLASLVSQLSIALENARLYDQIDVLFRQYISPDVATALLADPSQAALGGAVVEVSALFADLRGFTTFAERVSPQEVVAMLNRYFGLAAPCVLDQGGTVVQFIGDALLALFNAPARQPDHALRAARAGLAMQRAIDSVVADNAGWPRFRIGINTGPAVVGNIGSLQMRSFNATGDAINVAARLESVAQPGQVVIGGQTGAAIRDVADLVPLGDLQVKGRRDLVTAYVLTGLHERAEPVDPTGTPA